MPESHLPPVRSANALPKRIQWAGKIVYASQFLNPEALCNSTWMRLLQMYSISGDIHKSINSESLQPTWWKSFRKQIKTSLVDPQVCSLQQSTTIVRAFSLSMQFKPSGSPPFKLRCDLCSSNRATRRLVPHWRPPALQQRPGRWLSVLCRSQSLVVVQGITGLVGSTSPEASPGLYASISGRSIFIDADEVSTAPSRPSLFTALIKPFFMIINP